MSIFNLLVSRGIMHVPAPVIGFFAGNYVAGPELEDAVRVTRELNAAGIMSTIDILGEFVRKREESATYRDRCIGVLDAIRREGLQADLSLKPTQMGLKLDRDLALGLVISFATAVIGDLLRCPSDSGPRLGPLLRRLG